MIFNTLWTILLGVIGGIVSSLIVSKVFLIQSEYQIQLKFVDSIIRKLSYISAYLRSAKAIFELSYDQNVQVQKEMKEKGYRCEMEYYAANEDEDWISKNDVLAVFRKEIDKTLKSMQDDLANTPVEDAQLSKLLMDIMAFAHEISSVKEFTFSQISKFEKSRQKILEQYDACLHMSWRKMAKLVVKDKIMIALFILVGLLIVGTILAFYAGV